MKWGRKGLAPLGSFCPTQRYTPGTSPRGGGECLIQDGVARTTDTSEQPGFDAMSVCFLTEVVL